MLPVQSYHRSVMRIQETRPAVRRYQSFRTECPLQTHEMGRWAIHLLYEG